MSNTFKVGDKVVCKEGKHISDNSSYFNLEKDKIYTISKIGDYDTVSLEEIKVLEYNVGRFQLYTPKKQEDDGWDEATRGPKMSNPQGWTVLKYQVPIIEQFELSLPKDARIIRVDHIQGFSWIWALVNTQHPKETRKFVAFKTGGTNESVTDVNNLVYLGFHEPVVQQGIGLYLFEEM